MFRHFLAWLRTQATPGTREVAPPRWEATASTSRVAPPSFIPRAFAFDVPYSLEELNKRLRRAGPWDWEMRESSWYGDYLSAIDCPTGTRVRIYEDEPEPGSFTAEVIWRGEGSGQDNVDVDSASITVSTRILAAIKARNVRPTETID